MEIPDTAYTGSAPDLGAYEYGINFTATTNNVPVVNAGKDMIILAPVNKISLNGSVTGENKKNPNALSLKWSKISGPSEVTFSNAVNPVTMATFSKQGTYELMLSGSNAEYQVNDIVKVCYVKDHIDRSFNVGIGNDLFFEAEDYRNLVGAAKVKLNNKLGSKVVRSQNDHNEWTCTEYQISTQSAGTCYIWIRFSGNNKSKNNLYVSFNDLKVEQQISGSLNGKWDKDSWQKVVFPGTPEGSYLLRIRADKPGIMWDKIFITFDGQKHP